MWCPSVATSQVNLFEIHFLYLFICFSILLFISLFWWLFQISFLSVLFSELIPLIVCEMNKWPVSLISSGVDLKQRFQMSFWWFYVLAVKGRAPSTETGKGKWNADQVNRWCHVLINWWWNFKIIIIDCRNAVVDCIDTWCTLTCREHWFWYITMEKQNPQETLVFYSLVLVNEFGTRMQFRL